MRQPRQGIAARRAVELDGTRERMSDLTSHHLDNAAVVVVKAVSLRRVERQHANQLVVRYEWGTYAASQTKRRRFCGISEVERRVGVRNGMPIGGDPSAETLPKGNS